MRRSSPASPSPLPNPGAAPRCGGRGGFTLAELIVAVAAVALLTIGIGQLFSSVQRLVGTGAAIAETDQFARAIGSQLRSDFEAMNRLRSDELLIAIRNRRLGDVDGSVGITGRERAIYLTRDDREADLRAGILPYAEGSRAINVRLDEIIFLGFAGDAGVYGSAQSSRPGGGQAPATQQARIYYGHGLRPAQNLAFDVLDPPSGSSSNVRPREWVADGDFGAVTGSNNIFDPDDLVNGGQVTGRNEFAGDWTFLRQSLLLYGGLASGYPGSTGGGPFDTEAITFTPYIRGLEAERREVNGAGRALLSNANPTPRRSGNSGPYARLLRHGRTDLCAQSPEDVKRWLEGLAPPAPPGLPPDATALSSGKLEFDQPWQSNQDFNASPDGPLWERTAVPSTNGTAIQIVNRRGLFAAVAGCFSRMLAESETPLLDRGDSLNPNLTPQDRSQNSDLHESAYMDLHATFATRVSSIEIAWTDGKTWVYDDPLDRDLDGEPDTFRGDEIWYDIDFTRYSQPEGNDLRQADSLNQYGTHNDVLERSPEVPPTMRRDPVRGVETAGNGRYDALVTGGDPNSEGADEYLAIFPYRFPTNSTTPDQIGGYETGAYDRPLRIRFRFTVHDSQFRIPGGRQYEFVLPVDPR